MRCSRILAALLAAVTYAAPFTPVHTIVRDRGGVVHVKLIPTENSCGVLHLQMTGKKISRVAAKRSIQATTASPFNSLPPEVLYHTKALNLPCQFI